MTLVANRRGRRKVLWAPLFKMTMVLVPLCAAGVTMAYLFLAGQWNPLALWLGLAGGMGSVVLLVLSSLVTPLRRLPHIR